MSDLLLKDGRYTVRIRSHLRHYVARKKKRATYINDLIEADYNKSKGKQTATPPDTVED